MRPAARALLCALSVVVALVLAGCGDDDEPTSTTASGSTSTTGTTGTTSTETSTTSTAGGSGGGTGGGGGGSAPKPEPGSGSAADTPIQAVVAVLTDAGTDEQACGNYVTERFIKDSYGGEENCIAARADAALASQVTTTPNPNSTETHLIVVPTGGPYDGAKVEVDLVREDGGYRVDGLDAHVPAGP